MLHRQTGLQDKISQLEAPLHQIIDLIEGIRQMILAEELKNVQGVKTIVTSTTTSLQKEPSRYATPIANLRMGDTIVIIDASVDGYCKVKLESQIGYFIA